jgi:hypothetical protein
MAGVFRFIYSNGMIVGDTFERISVRHIDFNPDEIVEASYEIINNAPMITSNMQEMKAIKLSQSETEIFCGERGIRALGGQGINPFSDRAFANTTPTRRPRQE